MSLDPQIVSMLTFEGAGESGRRIRQGMLGKNQRRLARNQESYESGKWVRNQESRYKCFSGPSVERETIVKAGVWV